MLNKENSSYGAGTKEKEDERKLSGKPGNKAEAKPENKRQSQPGTKPRDKKAECSEMSEEESEECSPRTGRYNN